MSVLPTAVYRVREEKGVIIAHPGNKSLAFLSIAQKRLSSLVNLLNSAVWWRATRSLQRQASRVNFNSRQFATTLCWVESDVNKR